MQCKQVQEQVSALLDGELEGADRAGVEQHLAECAACRDTERELRTLDAQLRGVTQPMRHSAGAVASAAAARMLAGRPRPAHAPTSPATLLRSVIIATVAMACGFVLALLLFGPRPAPEDGPPVAVASPVPATSTVASVVAPAVIRAATGPIEVAKTAPPAWETVADPTGYACSTGAKVRTSRDAVCELQTSGGATVRMNASTELSFSSASDIQLSQGEIWCRTPDGGGLKVTPVKTTPAAAQPFSLHCGSDRAACCVLTCPSDGAAARIVAAAGRVEVQTPDRTDVVPVGSAVEFHDGLIQPVSRMEPALLSERWMHPLLVRKGPIDAELFSRVDALLAQIGYSKISYLYESDLRSLGEFGALPLLRFLQSPLGKSEPGRRQSAATILADVAPAWMVPDLIDLLEDADPAVRVTAARGLKRLTGQAQGLEPEAWEGPNESAAMALGQWRTWWAAERQAYPAPPPGVDSL